MPRQLPSFRRSAVAVSVFAGPVIGLASFLVQPPYDPDHVSYAAALADSAGAQIGLQAFVASWLFWGIGIVGLGHLASRRSPVLAVVGAVLAGFGTFSHAMYGGAQLLQLALAGVDPDAAVAALDAGENAVFMPFLALGWLGTLGGLTLLAVALMRSRTAPLWASVGLIVWLVVEWGLPNVVDMPEYVSLVVGIVAFAGLADAVRRSDLATWRTEAEVSHSVEVPAAAVTGAQV